MDKPVQLFPTLYNISDFISQDHPEYHPDTVSYTQYWTNIERKCLEGVWGHDADGDKGGWRYMPGFLYYYINLSKIIVEGRNTPTQISHPYLRDVEWMLSYGWLTARKFSGFSKDLYKTCHRVVKKINEVGIENLTPNESLALSDSENLYTPEGELKEYVNAVEYLYNTFSEPMGEPLFENEALNFFVLGARGFGKSYFCSNAVIGHEFNFFGKKKYDNSYLIDPSPVEIFVGSAIAAKGADLLKKFSSTQKYLRTGPGSWKNPKSPGYFDLKTKGTLKPNNGDNPYRHAYDSKSSGWNEEGTGTFIQHGTYTTENPQAAVGTRPTVMVIEEVGLLPNLLEVHGANETCQIRDTKFGSSFYIGTSGNMEKITDSKIVFEDPESYNFVPYPDLWENRAKPIGFFMPAYYVDNKFKDAVGNTDINLAWEQLQSDRDIKKKATSSSSLFQYVMSRPVVPSEMFLSTKNRFFPVRALKERYNELQTAKITKSIGRLEYTDEQKTSVKFVPDESIRPLEELRIKDDEDRTGAWIFYEHPSDNIPSFKLKKPLYKVTYDPVKDDKYGPSFASILVYKGFTNDAWEEEREAIQDDIVAELICRRDRVEEMHEEAVKVALYFQARVLVENNLPDFIRYCRLRKLYYILQPSPWEAISKIIKKPSKKYDVGVTMNKQLNVQTEQLINDILSSEWKVTEDKVKLWLHKLKSKRMILELIAYNREGNYDHVSSLKLLSLWYKNDLIYETESPDKEPDYMKKWDASLTTITITNNFNPYHVY